MSNGYNKYNRKINILEIPGRIKGSVFISKDRKDLILTKHALGQGYGTIAQHLLMKKSRVASVIQEKQKWRTSNEQEFFLNCVHFGVKILKTCLP